MTEPSRRAIVTGLAAAALAPGAAFAGGEGRNPRPFGFETVEARARELAAAPFDLREPTLPPPLAKLDYDAWRDIRFRPDKAFLNVPGSPYRLQLFHLGFLFKRPVTVNLLRRGVSTPIAYQPSLFDFGRTKIDKPLPVDLGFAGLRFHTDLNRPNFLDELIVFLGASYYRFLGRDQLYGLSARGLAVDVEGADGPEEFPFFREFWVETAEADGDPLVLYALLDSPALAGAYRFTVRPGAETSVTVEAALHPRREVATVALAPLTSMYFIGENDRQSSDDYRPELHDSDGLLMAAGTGEWLWRPLDNPRARRISSFADTDPKGFGLMQRDRSFEDYQDLEASYHRRPGYFVEPEGAWGEGSVMLMELPTDNETADNIVAGWRPKAPLRPGEPLRIAYRVRAIGRDDLHGNARVVNTYVVGAAASGAARQAGEPPALTRRFLVDFAGGDLGYHLSDPAGVAVVASTSRGQVVATSLTPNPHIRGLRAAIDVRLDAAGDGTELRAFLQAGTRALSETWTYAWAAA
ncbi:glucan biosynthesis protein G [Methylobacterium oxalidis]|uniref:Glucans biosynthesis protein D n=3 Tax=Methylobacterium oxalidis TaxID=944322 RepID=A0A512J0G9_9HYPH|nr:glucan biosynthesis protein G [Methylobacterium oxalidis]GEP03451.1 putative glucans biosynthesis protein D [Methylobacterium oxalidis]GLS63344.1 putative glucans biosynthesis protein D [Methylobacterium oxalidis]